MANSGRSSRRRSSPPPYFKPQFSYYLFLAGPLIFLFIVFASTLALAVLGFFSPPLPSTSSLAVQELPWLSRDADGNFRSRCFEFTRSRLEIADSHPSNDFLAAVIFNRVFDTDLFGITAYECKQWIDYMLYAGVEHIFWYDTAHSNAESQRAYLEGYIKTGLLTYHRFHELFPGNIKAGYHFEQDNSYRHFLATYKKRAKWVVEMDVDEYPFSSSDRNSCFLQRFLKDFEADRQNVTQILLQCMIFGGNPQGDLEHGWVIERYQRRKQDTEGVDWGHLSRQKPIFRASLCSGIIENNPHVFKMEEGETIVAEDEERMRMNHYWGARMSDFGPDTPDVVEMLVQDRSIQAMASEIKQATGLVERDEDTIGKLLRRLVRHR